MSIGAMNTSLNNNRKLLPKRDRFKSTLGGFNSESKTEYNLPKATSKQLRDIRKQLQAERKSRLAKTIVLTAILFVGLVVFLSYYSNTIRQYLWF